MLNLHTSEAYVDIHTLRYFLTVCQEGTMSRAAEVLHITQPTLSRQISNLERELGSQLLIRHSRHVEPTEKGKYLLRRAVEIVDLADKTRADFAADGSIVEGDISIAAGETYGMKFVAHAVSTFQAEYPQVRFHIHSADASVATHRLDSGIADFAVLLGYPSVSDYDYIRLRATDAWGVYMLADDPLVAKEAVSLEDLAGKPLISSERADKMGVMASWLGEYAGQVNVVATYNLVRSAEYLLREHMGYLIALDQLVPAGGGTGIEFRPIYPPAVVNVDVCWKRGAKQSHAIDLFRRHLIALNDFK